MRAAIYLGQEDESFLAGEVITGLDCGRHLYLTAPEGLHLQKGDSHKKTEDNVNILIQRQWAHIPA